MKRFTKGICLFISAIVLYIIFFCVEHTETSVYSEKYRNLKTDGFLVFSEHPENNRTETLKKLPGGYKFLDYSYVIKNSTISTFHRDVTSSQTMYNTNYPVYTLIIYKNEGRLLSICPGSHETNPFVHSQIINITGPKNTCILFDCDILHAGCFNECKEREIVQYKIAHHDDDLLLKHLNNVHIVKEENDCDDSVYNHFLRKCSFFFEMPINTVFYPLFQKKHEDGVLSKLQQYGGTQFYYN